MRDVNDFIDSFVKIEYNEEREEYCYHPFMIYAEEKPDQVSLAALVVDGVEKCYFTFCDFIEKGSNNMYMALDFPQIEDIKTDFVCIFKFVDNNLSVIGLPYDRMTGEKFEIINDAKALNFIVRDFKYVAIQRMNNMMKKMISTMKEDVMTFSKN